MRGVVLLAVVLLSAGIAAAIPCPGSNFQPTTERPCPCNCQGTLPSSCTDLCSGSSTGGGGGGGTGGSTLQCPPSTFQPAPQRPCPCNCQGTLPPSCTDLCSAMSTGLMPTTQSAQSTGAVEGTDSASSTPRQCPPSTFQPAPQRPCPCDCQGTLPSSCTDLCSGSSTGGGGGTGGTPPCPPSEFQPSQQMPCPCNCEGTLPSSCTDLCSGDSTGGTDSPSASWQATYNPTQPSLPDGHSPLLGFAFDGLPIFGPHTDGGIVPGDLDACNGREHPELGYVYHMTEHAPYIIGCYRGEVLCSTTKNVPGCKTVVDGGPTGKSLTCETLRKYFTSGVTVKQVPWQVVPENIPSFDGSAYNWLVDQATPLPDGINFIDCVEQGTTTLSIQSKGLPSHDVGKFPMNYQGGTTGKGHGDNPNTIAIQSFQWQIPANPELKATVPKSVLEDFSVLNMGPIGFALNGVPLFNPYNANQEDAVSPDGPGYEVMDLCGGHPQERGQYHYHAIPKCFLESMEAVLSSSTLPVSDSTPTSDSTSTSARSSDDATTTPTQVPANTYPTKPPNIIYVLIDDLGYGDVSFRDPEMNTPNIDKLKSEGVLLSRFYVQPLCTPTRAAFLTGRYPIRYGLQEGAIGPFTVQGLPLTETTLAEELKLHGYRTAIIGKWHLGFSSCQHVPSARGFDYSYGFFNGGIDYRTKMANASSSSFIDVHQGTMPVVESLELNKHSTKLWDEKTQQVIRNHAQNYPDSPLFLYYAMQNVHEPIQPQPPYLSQCRSVTNPKRKHLCAMANMADEAIGNMRDVLADVGMDSNTLLVVSSDNGGAAVSYSSSNLPLRGQKAKVYEGGVRASAIMHGPVIPGNLAGTTFDGLMHVTDLYPTFLAIAQGTSDFTVSHNRPLDGVNMWPAIVNKMPSPRTELLVNIKESGEMALISGDWKLLIGVTNKRNDMWVGAQSPVTWTLPLDLDNSYSFLFDLSSDEIEAVNQYDNEPEIVSQLRSRLSYYEGLVVPANDTTDREGCLSKATMTGYWLPWLSCPPYDGPTLSTSTAAAPTAPTDASTAIPATVATTDASPSQQPSKSKSSSSAAGPAVGAVIAVVVIIVGLTLYFKRRQTYKGVAVTPPPDPEAAAPMTSDLAFANPLYAHDGGIPPPVYSEPDCPSYDGMNEGYMDIAEDSSA